MKPMLRLRFPLLVAVVAVAAHDVTFLIGHGVDGYASALGATGHDSHWLPMAASVGVLLAGATLLAAARWWRLRHQVRDLEAEGALHTSAPIVPGALRLAAQLFVAALTVFVIQENLEAIATGSAAPGPGIVLAAGYLAAVPVVAAVALLFAVMSELIDARILRLERAVAAARGALPRPSSGSVPVPPRGDRRPRRSRHAQPDLGRAPPASAHA